jgi:signal transduction histidine kinase
MNSSLFEIRHLDIMKDGFLTLNAEWNFLFINKIAADIIHRENYELIGKNFWEMIPELVGTDLETTFRGVMADRIVKRTQVKRLKTGTWYNLIIFPTATGISIYMEDITKEKLTEEALQQSERQLKILVENLNFADQSKTAFISTLSHELRNPMASIMLGTSLLRKDPLIGKVANRAIDIIDRQSTQLNNLVDDLLDVTRITQNKMVINKERIELNHLIDLILEDYKDRFNGKGIGVEVETAHVPLFLDLDIARFNQVICNLLDNALKFTNSGGTVSISLRQDGPKEKAIITIKDSGIGIKPEIQKQLFKPFVQADLSLDRGFGGLGLGLVIVKGIVEMHGGNVGLHSEGIGAGTTFDITLPLPS